MTGECACPIYYRGVVSVEQGSVIKFDTNYLSLSKKRLSRRSPLSRSRVSSMTMAGSRSLASRSHISSVTGECTHPIDYLGVVSVEEEV